MYVNGGSTDYPNDAVDLRKKFWYPGDKWNVHEARECTGSKGMSRKRGNVSPKRYTVSFGKVLQSIARVVVV